MPDTEALKIGDTDWVKVRYNELEENDLFWRQTTKNDFNSPMRKIDNKSAWNMREQIKVEMEPKKIVWLKE